MRDSTKLFIETEIPDNLVVDMEACAENGYDWFEYFVPGKSMNIQSKHKEKNRTERCRLVRLKMAEILFKNDIKFSDIKTARLYIDPECDTTDSWDDDPGYSISYWLFGECYLILEGKRADYIFKVDSDFYCHSTEYDDEDVIDKVEFIGKFE